MRIHSPFSMILPSTRLVPWLILLAGFVHLPGLARAQPADLPKELPGLEGYEIKRLGPMGGVAVEDMQFDAIVSREVLLNGWLPYVGVTETYLVACTYPDCGSKRIVFRVSRTPYSGNRLHRTLALQVARGDQAVHRPFYDTTLPFAEQTLGFRTYAADTASDHAFLGTKRGPPDAPLLLEASASFFGKHHSNSCVQAGYSLIPDSRLDFRSTAAVETKKLPGLEGFDIMGLGPMDGFALADLRFETIVSREVTLYGRPPFSMYGRSPFSAMITETFLIACTYPDCGSKRIILQVCRLPYAENPAHRRLAVTLPLKESPRQSRIFDAALKYTAQSSGFHVYASEMELTWPFLGQKNPNSVQLLLEASEAFFGKHHRDHCVKAGYAMVAADRLQLSLLPRSRKDRSAR